jgi:hypothetical protein
MLVCEGYAEDALAQAIRDIYLPRGCGVVLQRKNARGFGGARALDLALEMQLEGAYQAYGVLVDTDSHWGDSQRALAQARGIVAIENTPCIESTLLRVDGYKAPTSTDQCKRHFTEVYGSPADREGLIARKFLQEQFDDARETVNAIDQLLKFIRR